MISIMSRNKTGKTIIQKGLLIVFYLVLWQFVSEVIGNSLLLPSPVEVFRSLFSIILDPNSWEAIFSTFLRLLAGFGVGSVLGIILAVLTARFRLIYIILLPLRHLIKSTPVLSFVLILLVSVYSNFVPVIVASIMVLPLMWSTTETALLSLDPKLSEMGKIYYRPIRRVILVSIPQMLPQILSSAVTALGFAWKAVITAEVLSLPKKAIGNQMYLSKLYLEMPDMFAWTALVITLSLLLEFALKRTVRRWEAAHD